MSDKPELKPCPFCGGAPDTCPAGDVECCNEGCPGPFADNAAQWNTRAPDLLAENAELKDRLLAQNRPFGFDTWEDYHKHVSATVAENERLRMERDGAAELFEEARAERDRLRAALEGLYGLHEHMIFKMDPEEASRVGAILDEARAALGEKLD